jgi:hypothetical protein
VENVVSSSRIAAEIVPVGCSNIVVALGEKSGSAPSSMIRTCVVSSRQHRRCRDGEYRPERPIPADRVNLGFQLQRAISSRTAIGEKRQRIVALRPGAPVLPCRHDCDADGGHFRIRWQAKAVVRARGRYYDGWIAADVPTT